MLRQCQLVLICISIVLIFSVKWEHRCSDRWCFIETMAATAPWPAATFSRQCHGRVAEARCSRCSSSLWMISARWMIESSIIAARPLSPTKRICRHPFFFIFTNHLYGVWTILLTCAWLGKKTTAFNLCEKLINLRTSMSLCCAVCQNNEVLETLPPIFTYFS